MKSVHLVVVAHPDDEVLGFGATGAKLASRGEPVRAVILCGSVDARTERPSTSALRSDTQAASQTLGFAEPVVGAFPNLTMNTVAHLDLVQFIEAQIVQFGATHIYTHHPSDINDDHRQVYQACIAASRLHQRRENVPALLGLYLMEVPSATDWSYASAHEQFSPNVYVDVSTTLDAKLEALACYRNVMRPHPHPRSEQSIRALASYRGAQSGKLAAEAFQAIYISEI